MARRAGGTSNHAEHHPFFLRGVVGNTIYPEWIAHQVGCALVRLKSEAERRAEEAEKALAKEKEINKVLKDLLAGRAA